MSRSEFATVFRPARATALGRLLGAVRTASEALRRERRLRATIRQLHGLSDRTLRDIGLERGRIEDAVRDRCREG